MKHWFPLLARVLRLITAEPAVLCSRLMLPKIAVQNIGPMLVHIQRNPHTNANTLRFYFPVPCLKKISKSAH